MMYFLCVRESQVSDVTEIALMTGLPYSHLESLPNGGKNELWHAYRADSIEHAAERSAYLLTQRPHLLGHTGALRFTTAPSTPSGPRC